MVTQVLDAGPGICTQAIWLESVFLTSSSCFLSVYVRNRLTTYWYLSLHFPEIRPESKTWMYANTSLRSEIQGKQQWVRGGSQDRTKGKFKRMCFWAACSPQESYLLVSERMSSEKLHKAPLPLKQSIPQIGRIYPKGCCLIYILGLYTHRYQVDPKTSHVSAATEKVLGHNLRDLLQCRLCRGDVGLWLWVSWGSGWAGTGAGSLLWLWPRQQWPGSISTGVDPLKAKIKASGQVWDDVYIIWGTLIFQTSDDPEFEWKSVSMFYTYVHSREQARSGLILQFIFTLLVMEKGSVKA